MKVKLRRTLHQEIEVDLTGVPKEATIPQIVQMAVSVASEREWETRTTLVSEKVVISVGDEVWGMGREIGIGLAEGGS